MVDCTEANQIARTTARSGLPETVVRAIMAHQLTRSARLARADDIISNENGLEILRARVETLHAQYLSLADQASPKP